MIAIELVAKGILGHGMYVAECGMSKLHNGDKLTCEYELAKKLLAKHPDNFSAGPHFDKELPACKWEVELAAPHPVVAKTGPLECSGMKLIEEAHKPLSSSKVKVKHAKKG